MGDSYQASHILVKHEGSRRKASWKDPEGAQIAVRSRDQAAQMLEAWSAELRAIGEPQALHANLADILAP